MKAEKDVTLCRVQQDALDGVLNGLKIGSIIRLSGGIGRGKSTVLRELLKQTDGMLLTMRDFVECSRKNHPLSLEETLYQIVFEAMDTNDLVVVDDLHLIDLHGAGCHMYPRAGYFNAVLMGLCHHALERGKKLVFSTKKNLAEAAEQRSYDYGIGRFKPDDYATLLAVWLNKKNAAKLDTQKIHRFAPKLNAHQLKAACLWLRQREEITTDQFIDYLRSQRLASNVDLGEVQVVDLKDLKGVDDVLKELEINIILPLQNDELANELSLRSKRGVLLYGPPGTGKTTIGRALAHRLKSKFFLIDGTFISGTQDFYGRIRQVFETAKDNAPAVIFIDDADAIFEDQEERGLYRYLLTMIDGLESESAGRICVMMTAMNVGQLPPALIRSGRVELWLEMKLPDDAARESILTSLVTQLPPHLRGVTLKKIAEASEGFTGADLKRTVEDSKALFAYDRSRNSKLREADDYFLQAIEGVRENKKRFAEAEALAMANAASSKMSFPNFFGGAIPDEVDE